MALSVRRGRPLLLLAAGAALALSVTACSSSRAEVGECVAQTGEDEVSKVDCASPEAQYKVVGIEEEGTYLPAFACNDFPETVTVYSEVGGGGDGFTLCLGNK